ncbi:MAG: ABC transporter permease [Geminicoccaceae bacterium]|nr:MAG: ABC transporter permease [Geminicoccaceae bacterium]
MAAPDTLSRTAPPSPGGLLRAILNTWRFARRHPTVVIGGGLLALIGLATLLAPWLSLHDPLEINPLARLRPPSADHWLGTDAVGRDLWSRTIHGGQVSLVIGIVVALLTTAVGLVLGLLSGYVRWLDAILMRFMDGLMSIPAILLAIALMAVAKASIVTVIVAITIVELPRVVRLVRSVVLSIREQPYVEAAIVVGSKTPRILVRHILPNTIAPLTVQATYICAAAILIESLLSFLGAGTPPEVPSWGNIMAQGRIYFQLAPWIILIPGVFLATTVLAINLVGDGLRDMLDPRFARRL